MAIGGVSPEGVAIPELGVAPLVDPETDLEDELPTPEDSMLVSIYSDSSPEGVRIPGVRPAPLDIADLELEKALLSVSILPVIVTPIVDPVVVFLVAPCSYPEPPLPVMPDDDPGAMSRISPLTGARSWMCFHHTSFCPSPPRSRRPCGMTMTTCHHPVRAQWTSTFRERVICCWGIRRTYPFSRCR